MRLTDLWPWGRKPPPARQDTPASTFQASVHSGVVTSQFAAAASVDPRQVFRIRSDLLRIALRDVTALCGMPAAWIELRPLAATSTGSKEPTVQARLVLRQWQPLVLQHAAAIEQLLRQRIAVLDPQSVHWLSAVLWQVAIPADTPLAPLPGPAVWARQPSAPAPGSPPPPSGGGSDGSDGSGVIAGPVHIPRSAAPRERLERSSAWDDGPARQFARAHAATEPAGLGPRPAA